MLPGGIFARVSRPKGDRRHFFEVRFRVRFWDVETATAKEAIDFRFGTSSLIYPAESAYAATYGCIVQFSPNGRQLAVGSGDGTIRIIDLATKKVVHEKNWALKDNRVIRTSHFTYMRSGRLCIVDFSGEPRVVFWQPGKGSKSFGLKLPTRSINDIALNRDESLLAVAQLGGHIHLWDLKQNRPHLPAEGHKYFPVAVAITADGKTVASTGVDGTVRLWDPNTGRQRSLIQRFPASEYSRILEFSDSAGKLLCMRNRGSVALLDARKGDVLRTYKIDARVGMRSAAVNWNSGRLAVLTSSYEGETMEIFDVDTARHTASFDAPGTRAITFSPDGLLIAYNSDSDKVSARKPSSKQTLWSIPLPPRRGRSLPGADRNVSLACSTDGKYLALRLSRTLYVWDRVQRQLLYSLSSPGYAPVRFSHDGRWIATTKGTSVLISDAKTGKPIKLFPGHTNGVMFLAFQNDGKRIASASRDGTLIVWDLSDMTQPAAKPR